MKEGGNLLSWVIDACRKHVCNHEFLTITETCLKFILSKKATKIEEIFIVDLTLYKGQLISKCLFGIFNFPKKRTKKFNFTTMVPQVELFSFIFGRIEIPKRHFEIN